MKRILSILLLSLVTVAVKAEAPKAEPVITEGKWVHAYVYEAVDPRDGISKKQDRVEYVNLSVVKGVNKYVRTFYVSGRIRTESGEWNLNGDSLELWAIPTAEGHPSQGIKAKKPEVMKVQTVSAGVVSLGLLERVKAGVDELNFPRYEMRVNDWKEFKLEQEKK